MIIKAVREKNPLIHHITNYVTANDCANVTIAMGASAAMADFYEEQADFARISSALVLNTGTINQLIANSMLKATKEYTLLNKPIIFDPVALGVSKVRDGINFELLNLKGISIVKANASEMASVIGLDGKARGVDSTFVIDNEFLEKAKEYSYKTKRVLAITGKIDYIINQEHIAKIYNGSIMATKITGAGCMCASLCGVFAGVLEDKFQASLYALLSFGIASEIAQELSSGSGNFRVNLIDALSNLNDEEIKKRAKYEII
ncbi:hydroxyethylthiazole kinase [Campylobacter sp. IFREMER_LSEM_CL2090]|uniref:hydroxyethylthiazole kinase n=1 Tax=Campylobacter sp. IFREMER_LSEM_CL2090 TaxID=2911617 RepID=UPI0021E78C4D|nr:hydroxyethylthiazole kinase [Campylobacter sp. IFREMER_LSEM_CL2090]MCV3403845.1 hydroxyethylthiazole kinase [Campylobacter sp. IFREMER_LSEM_CL2090]